MNKGHTRSGADRKGEADRNRPEFRELSTRMTTDRMSDRFPRRRGENRPRNGVHAKIGKTTATIRGKNRLKKLCRKSNPPPARPAPPQPPRHGLKLEDVSHDSKWFEVFERFALSAGWTRAHCERASGRPHAAAARQRTARALIDRDVVSGARDPGGTRRRRRERPRANRRAEEDVRGTAVRHSPCRSRGRPRGRRRRARGGRVSGSARRPVA